METRRRGMMLRVRLAAVPQENQEDTNLLVRASALNILNIEATEQKAGAAAAPVLEEHTMTSLDWQALALVVSWA